MIGKARTGRNFQGLQNYLLRCDRTDTQDRVAWVSTRNLPDDPDLAAHLMEVTAMQSQRVEKPVYHLTVSVPPEERLSRQELREVAETLLRDLGLEEHQALLVAHRDTEHQHVHVMVNRVHPETHRAWKTSHDYARIESSLRRQELERELRQVPGRHAPTPGRDRTSEVGLTSGQRRERERTGHQTFADHVRSVARDDLRQARSWKELHERLSELGLAVRKRGRGLVVTDGQHQVKASFVDRGSSLPKLEARLGPFEPASKAKALDGRWRSIQSLRNVAQELTQHQQSTRRAVTETVKAARSTLRPATQKVPLVAAARAAVQPTIDAIAATRSTARLPSLLVRRAEQLVGRLGWKLAARVVPLPQLQLLRVTVSLAKRGAEALLETARSVSR